MNYPVHTLDTGAAKDLYDAACEIAFQGGHELFTTEEGVRQMAAQSQDAVDHLCAVAQSEIGEFAQHGNTTGMFVLRGLKVPSGIDRTHPTDGSMPRTFESEAMGVTATMAAALAGSPFGYTTNPRGKAQGFVANVAPVPTDVRIPGASRLNEVRTGRSTGWHSEAGPAPIDKRIQFLSLFCVRSQSEVPTQVIASSKLTAAITATRGERRLHDLEQSAYLLNELIVPGSTTKRRPIATQTDRGYAYAYTESYGDYTDELTKNALDDVATAIETVVPTSHVLESGDVLYIDNNGLHRRQAFTPRCRWLMRVFVGHKGTETFVDPSDLEDIS